MAAFWKQNFVPNNAALVVAGEISMNELRALAEKAFAGWERGQPARPVGAPTTTAARLVIVDVPEHHNRRFASSAWARRARRQTSGRCS